MKRASGILLIAGALVAGQVNAEEAGMQKAAFGAGCFWGVEKVFGDLPGVLSTQVGYTGGSLKNPTYEAVCNSDTGHAEAVEITYDPSKISYEDLLEIFWMHHDPTTPDQQGNDVGHQYRSVIFYYTPAQKVAAARSWEALEKSGIFKNPIVTEIEEAHTFYPAEAYHQKYLKKNPFGYCHIQLQSKKIREVLKASKI